MKIDKHLFVTVEKKTLQNYKGKIFQKIVKKVNSTKKGYNEESLLVTYWIGFHVQSLLNRFCSLKV